MDLHLLIWLWKLIFPDRREARIDSDVWLGALSAILGVLSLLLGIGAMVGVTSPTSWHEMGGGSVLFRAILGFALALIAGRCGRLAPTVTTKYSRVARFGVVISSISSLLSAIALALSLLRLAQW